MQKLSILGLVLFSNMSGAVTPPQVTDDVTVPLVETLYHDAVKNPTQTIAQRIEYFSRSFLGKPYILYPLGEGANGDIDQHPLYRFDGFDCETFVSTVVALSAAQSPQEFEDVIQQLRYNKTPLSYINRNHFTGLDWNNNNHKKGFIKDITHTITAPDGSTIAKEAITQINKRAWIEKTIAQRTYLPNDSSTSIKEKQKKLIAQAQKLPIQTARTPYIPTKKMFDAQGNPIADIFSQIPDAAIIEIVRPNWQLTSKIGTNLNVSHLGFVFRKDGRLWFRHASTNTKRVIDVPFSNYLKKTLQSPTIKGINIQKVTH